MVPFLSPASRSYTDVLVTPDPSASGLKMDEVPDPSGSPLHFLTITCDLEAASGLRRRPYWLARMCLHWGRTRL